MVISVCVGSSCHLSGSYDIINKFEELIEKNNLKDKITLKASFCLGQCANGVCVKFDDLLIKNCKKENVETLFKENILNE